MRGSFLSPVVSLVFAASVAWSQPGPEQPPPDIAPEPTSVSAPIPDAANDPIAVAEEPVATVVDSSAPVAEGAAPTDSVARDSADKARARAEAEAQRSMRGRFGPGSMPPRETRPPVVAPVVAEDTAEYEDEHGGGRKLRNDPRASKLYRSPRKAFFYSLVVPGAGQAWCGAYARAGLFLAAEAGLAYGWYQISIRDARAKGREAQRYADQHWSATRYEATRKRLYDEAGTDNKNVVDQASPYRDRYCDAIYGYDENPLRTACLDADTNYQAHVALLDDANRDVEYIGRQREANIKDLPTFYDRIGRDEEFVPGWEDATSSGVSFATLRAYGSALTDNDPATTPSAAPWGTSQMRAVYLGMRQDADDLAATQSWFLGGLVLNHLLSAVDAALTAQRFNRRLYGEEKTSWVDGLHVQGGLAWANGPATRADMFLEF